MDGYYNLNGMEDRAGRSNVVGGPHYPTNSPAVARTYVYDCIIWRAWSHAALIAVTAFTISSTLIIYTDYVRFVSMHRNLYWY